MTKTISGTAEINSVRLKEQASDPSTPSSNYWQVYVKSGGLYVIDDTGTVTGPFTASGSAYTEGARVTHSSTQSISNSTDTALAFDTEDYDTDTIHDTVTNNTRLTATTAGKYIILGNVEFDSNSTGVRELVIKLNGTTELARVNDNANTTTATRLFVSTLYDLSASDYVELIVWQSSGGNLNVPATTRYPHFGMQRVG